MRPQTWSKPKALVSVAGKPAIDHLLDSFQGIPKDWAVEYTFIIAPHVGEQIPAYLAYQYPEISAHYFTQQEMGGQSQAVALASEYLRGPTIVIYADTLIETDFSFLVEEKPDAVAWVKTVPDPRRFGVAVTGEDGYIRELVEKPLECDNRLAVVGCYYFTKGEDLAAAIEEQFRLKKKFNNEYFLTDAINILLHPGTKMRTREVESWLDTGTIEATLETNRILLARTQAGVPARWNPEACKQANVTIVPPVFIHDTAELRNASHWTLRFHRSGMPDHKFPHRRLDPGEWRDGP